MDNAVDQVVRFKLNKGIDDMVFFQVEDVMLRGQVVEQLDVFVEKYQPDLHALRCDRHPDKSPLSIKVEETEGIVIGEFCPHCFERWITKQAFGPSYGSKLAEMMGIAETDPESIDL